MPTQENILLWVLLIPLLGAGVVLFIPGKQKDLIRWFTNAVFALGFLASLPLVKWFDNSNGGFQFVVDMQWVPSPAPADSRSFPPQTSRHYSPSALRLCAASSCPPATATTRSGLKPPEKTADLVIPYGCI